MSAQPESSTTGTVAGDEKLARAAQRRGRTNAPAITDVSKPVARNLYTEIDREAAARDALLRLASAGEVKPTRAQRRAAEVAASTAAGTVTEKPAKLPKVLKPGKAPKAKKPKTAKDRRKARKKFVSRIPRKYKVTRGVARVTLGTVALVAGTVRVTGKGVKATAKGVGAVRPNVPRPRLPRVAGRFGMKLSCCDKTYSSAQALNAHFLAEHEGEESAARGQEQALLAPGTTRSSTNKLLVLLPPSHAGKRRRVPAGRHRPGHNRVSADRYVQAHREQITRIGDRAMTDCGEARNVAQAFMAWGSLMPRADRPWSLDDLRAVLVGMERTMIVGTEAIDMMERTLNRPGGEQRGCNIDMSITRPGARRAREGLIEAARGLTQIIADFELYYQPWLRGQLAAPSITVRR